MNTNLPLISVDELAALPPERVLPVDCRFDLSAPEQAHREYLQAHLPGAVHADLDKDLSDLDLLGRGLGRHPLPSARAFGVTLGRWGWQPDRLLVAYDAGSGAMAAARLWWLMRWMGVAARVLDGGLAAWQAAGRPVTDIVPAASPTRVDVHFDDAMVLSTAQLKVDLVRGRVLLLDARAEARYRGLEEPIDPRAGHVPGARNRPFADNLDAGRFRAAGVLRDGFLQVLDGYRPERVVHMCGSGVTACHNLLAMEQAGLHGSRLYAPSWSGWVSDPDNPVETDQGSAD